jgi:hypothetical protein
VSDETIQEARRKSPETIESYGEASIKGGRYVGFHHQPDLRPILREVPSRSITPGEPLDLTHRQNLSAAIVGNGQPRPRPTRGIQMTALVLAFTRASGTNVDVESLGIAALFSAVGLLVSFCMIHYGFDFGPF